MGALLAIEDRVGILTHAAAHRLTAELVYEQGIGQIFRSSVPARSAGSGRRE